MEVIFEAYVVYFNPADFPGEYVVRRQVVTSDGPIYHERDLLCRGKTLESVRSHIPDDKVLLSRHPSDPSVIVETWI